MATRSINIGQVSTIASSISGKTTTIYSGSIRPGVLGGTEILVNVGPVEVDPTVSVTSQKSVVSYHPTLFEDFRLSADGIYNFYVEDEQTNSLQDPSASLGDLPRYVELRWRPVPFRAIDIPVSRKGIKPFDPRTEIPQAVVPIPTAKNSVANGYVSPGVVSALLVPPIVHQVDSFFDEDGFLLDPNAAGALAANHIGSGSSYVVSVPTSQTLRIRANFIDPSIAGALDPNRIAVSSDQVHLSSLGSFAKLAGGLEVISEFNQDVPVFNPPPKFVVSNDAPTLAYVGYVIERHTLDRRGSMRLSKTIDISDPSVRSFIDRDVVYGGVYAYRIRSIVQWTHPSDVGFFGPSTFDRLPAFNTAAPSPQKDATFYAGEWSDWSRTQIVDTSPPDPPDELTVLPRSHDGTIRVVWKMPADPQLDLASVHLFRAEVTSAGTGDWKKLLDAVPTNGFYVDHDVLPFEDGHRSYVYAMYTTSLHGETSVLSEQIRARIGRRTARKEWSLVQTRPRGADPREHASGVSETEPRPLVAQRRAAFYCREALSNHPLFAKTYVVEAQSLSTGERVEVSLSVDSTDIKPSSGRRRLA